MKVTILGSGGQIGAYLTDYLRDKGHAVTFRITLPQASWVVIPTAANLRIIVGVSSICTKWY